jgi:hypothetical protein
MKKKSSLNQSHVLPLELKTGKCYTKLGITVNLFDRSVNLYKKFSEFHRPVSQKKEVFPTLT